MKETLYGIEFAMACLIGEVSAYLDVQQSIFWEGKKVRPARREDVIYFTHKQDSR